MGFKRTIDTLEPALWILARFGHAHTCVDGATTERARVPTVGPHATALQQLAGAVVMEEVRARALALAREGTNRPRVQIVEADTALSALLTFCETVHQTASCAVLVYR